MVLVKRSPVEGDVRHEKSSLESFKRVRESASRLAGTEPPALRGLLNSVVDCVAVPTNVATISVEVSEVSAGRVDCKPTPKQVRVAQVATLDVVVQMRDGVVKVVIFIMFPVKRTEPAYLVRGHFVGVDVCKGASALDGNISYREHEVDVSESGYSKMGMGLPDGSSRENLTRVD